MENKYTQILRKGDIVRHIRNIHKPYRILDISFFGGRYYAHVECVYKAQYRTKDSKPISCGQLVFNLSNDYYKRMKELENDSNF